jgi:LysR family glycine cleavage system transcriptional activator
MSIRRRLPVLSSLRAFEAAGRHLSFSRAADELLITQSAVSHHVRKLEEELGVSLFSRHARSVALTPEGKRYLASLTHAFDLMAAATEEIRASERRTLRVSLLASFATHWLIPRLSGFTAAHPDIDLVLEPSIRPADLSVDPIDAAIRYGRGGWHGAQSQPFLGEQIFPVCSPALLEGGASLRRPQDLLGQTLLFSFSKDPFEWQAWSELAGVDVTQARHVMLHDYNIVLQAAVDGQGVAMGRRNLIADHLRKGTLVELFPDLRVAGGIGYWVVMPEAAKPQARAFAQWLLGEAAAMHEPDS